MWTVRCPLICFYAVEIHLPHRVARQFGLEESWPLKEVSTNIELHKYVYTHESCPLLHILRDAYNSNRVLPYRFDRVKQRKVTNFAHHRHDMVDWWWRLDDSPRLGGPPLPPK